MSKCLILSVLSLLLALMLTSVLAEERQTGKTEHVSADDPQSQRTFDFSDLIQGTSGITKEKTDEKSTAKEGSQKMALLLEIDKILKTDKNAKSESIDYSLVVSARLSVINEIEIYLSKCRKERKLFVDIELHFVVCRFDVAKLLKDEIERDNPDVVLEMIKREEFDCQCLKWATLTVYNGEAAALKSEKLNPTIVDGQFFSSTECAIEVRPIVSADRKFVTIDAATRACSKSFKSELSTSVKQASGDMTLLILGSVPLNGRMQTLSLLTRAIVNSQPE